MENIQKLLKSYLKVSDKMNNQRGKLYLIPTPIGNMDDLSKRIINTLKEVDVIFCEDTRTTNILLNYLEIKNHLISNHKFNESKNITKIIKFLNDNKKVGIVSDRGTPIISDPGFILTQEVINAGFEVIALPGPTAFIPALIASGIAPQPFLFYGFLDSKKSQRKKELEKLKFENSTLIFYEAPHRLKETIIDMKDILGNNRKISISREITKKYEKTYRGTLNNIIEKIDEIKGEFVIIISGNNEIENYDEISLLEHINIYIDQGMSTMSAIKQVAKDRNMKKGDVYDVYQKENKK